MGLRNFHTNYLIDIDYIVGLAPLLKDISDLDNMEAAIVREAVQDWAQQAMIGKPHFPPQQGRVCTS